MPIDVAGKAKGFLLKPSATFRATKEESLSSAFQYYVILLVVFSVVTFVVYALVFTSIPAVMSGRLPEGFGAELSIYIAFFLFMVRFYGVFLTGLVYHVFVLLFGGTQGAARTIRTLMYASTPAIILGWIPIIAVVGDVWTFILFIIGIRENQDMPLGRAVLVAILPLILSLISAGLIVLAVSTLYRARLHALMGI
jgi:hypothetical protein